MERFSQRDYLVEWSHTLSSLATSSFDAIISIDTDLSSGIITTVTSSISSTKEPVERIDGWVFKPNSNEGAVNVIWISNFSNQQHQPLLIKELGNYMDQYGCPPYIRRVAGKIISESFDSDTGQYDVVYIAKHALNTRTSSNKQQQQQRWCTDIRIHNSSRYPAGVNMTLSPETGMRVEITSSKTSIRIYTTSSDMEEQHVSIRILPGTDHQYTCNGVSLIPRIAINNTPTNNTTTTTPPPDSVPTPPQSAEIKSPTTINEAAINAIPVKPPSPPSVPNDSSITTLSSSSQQREPPPTPSPSPHPPSEKQAISTDRRRASVVGKITISQQPSRPDTPPSHLFTAEQHKQRNGQSPKLISRRTQQQQQQYNTTKVSPTERQRLVVPEGYKLIPQQQV